MKRGQTAEGLVEKTEFGGKGIVTVEGEPVRVKGVLKGQKILLRIKKAGKGKAEGNLMKVLEPSPDETVPDCVPFGACGGCALRWNSLEPVQVHGTGRRPEADRAFEPQGR